MYVGAILLNIFVGNILLTISFHLCGITAVINKMPSPLAIGYLVSVIGGVFLIECYIGNCCGLKFD
jgi:hypothetical protein